MVQTKVDAILLTSQRARKLGIGQESFQGKNEKVLKTLYDVQIEFCPYELPSPSKRYSHIPSLHEGSKAQELPNVMSQIL